MQGEGSTPSTGRQAEQREVSMWSGSQGSHGEAWTQHQESGCRGSGFPVAPRSSKDSKVSLGGLMLGKLG
jgi:hypothetical protein